jgi:hypothetical protein
MNDASNVFSTSGGKRLVVSKSAKGAAKSIPPNSGCRKADKLPFATCRSCEPFNEWYRPLLLAPFIADRSNNVRTSGTPISF